MHRGQATGLRIATGRQRSGLLQLTEGRDFQRLLAGILHAVTHVHRIATALQGEGFGEDVAGFVSVGQRDNELIPAIGQHKRLYRRCTADAGRLPGYPDRHGRLSRSAHGRQTAAWFPVTGTVRSISAFWIRQKQRLLNIATVGVDSQLKHVGFNRNQFPRPLAGTPRSAALPAAVVVVCVVCCWGCGFCPAPVLARS